MTFNDAVVLARSLRSGPCHATVDVVGNLSPDVGPDARLTFRGGRFGSHSLSVSASDKARVLAHWRGYCEANFRGSSGIADRITAGAKVQFQRGMFGLWAGTVERLGVRRDASHAPFAIVRITRRNGSVGRYDVNLTACTLLRPAGFRREGAAGAFGPPCGAE